MSWLITPKKSARAGVLFAFLLGAPLPAAPEAEPSPRVVEAINRGVSLMGQYQYDQAVQAFQEVLQAEPGSTTARINLAISLFNRNRKEDQDLETAQKVLNEVLQKEPDNVRALYFKGILLQHIGKAEEAIPCFEKVVRKMPADGAAWYLLGMCKQRLDQSGEPELLRAVQCRPYLFSAYYKLSQIALREGKEEKARQFLEQFTKLRESPLGEVIELPQYNQMGGLALAQPLKGQGRRPVSASRFSIGAPRTLFEQTDPASPRGVQPFGGVAAADLNQDGLADLILTTGTKDHPGHLLLLLGDLQVRTSAQRSHEAGRDALPRVQADRQVGPTKVMASSGVAFREATTGSGLEAVRNALSCAVGDYDNDDKADLFVACAGENYLFKGKGDGTFTDVTRQSGTDGGQAVSRFAMFLDADHDGDLDILVCNAGKLDGSGPAANQLLRNNGDGTFTDIAREAGIACDDSFSVYAQAGDVDGDRDMDLVIFREGQPARTFLNDLLGKYHELIPPGLEILGEQGAVMQDFDGDGQLDILALGGKGPALHLFLGDGHGHFTPSESFEGAAKSVASWGPLRGMRVADIDLDGDLDIALFSSEAHVLLNDGDGKFVLQPLTASANKFPPLVAAELLEVTGDYVPDLLCLERLEPLLRTHRSDEPGRDALPRVQADRQVGPTSFVERGATNRLSVCVGELSSPPMGFAIQPSGIRSRDGRTRSPADGYGVKITVRVGLWEQVVTRMGLWGGVNQSEVPMIFGLNGVRRADYVNLLWPDGVNQVEIGLAAGQVHSISETQRKISSCPVLFAWNGERFEFVTDFAGVGGLGYFSASGVSAPAQVLEHVKIEPHQLCVKDGFYELRVTEPMEETAYVDRLELLAIDHPANQPVFPDERLAINGPPPTHELLVVEKTVFPVRALASNGADCTENLLRVDRVYACEPPLDRRYIGFCQPHTLELDFGDRFSALEPGRDALPRVRADQQVGPTKSMDKVFLFIHGFIEYPYSQTTYAASQSRIGWEPIRVDRLGNDGQWQTIVPDGGAPGGMARMMTIDLSGKVDGSTRKLRLTTNLEIYYDQIFIARDAGLAQVKVQSVPLADAELRRVGFAREYSPDGRLPWIYDYDRMDAAAPFHVLRGAYTRYGPVKELLAAFDDKYVLVGPGDEIALRFDGSSLAATPADRTRSFVLVSHAYCKDMDLYTATPQTVEPLPFRAMSRYPYPPTEHYPDDEEHRAFLKTYNTQIIE